MSYDIDSPDYRDTNVGEGMVPTKEEREQGAREKRLAQIKDLSATVMAYQKQLAERDAEIERLQKLYGSTLDDNLRKSKMYNEASAEIARLRAEVKALRHNISSSHSRACVCVICEDIRKSAIDKARGKS